MARMVIHAGFHKTGTTSVQKMLGQNRRRLSEHADIFLRKNMTPVCEAARTYSATRASEDLIHFTYELGKFLEQIKDAPDRQICISSEDLAGHMPGRRSLQTYAATPILMKAFVHTVEKTMPTPPEMIFYFSTRAADAWLKSCYGQHLGVVRLSMDLEEYKHAYAESARLDRIIDKVRLAVAPHRVEFRALETTQDTPLGPLTPLLDLLEIPAETRSKLLPLPPANVALPDALQAEYLRINKSDLDMEAVRLAKKDAHQQWRKACRTEQA
ncbi:hypothetical protein SAMN05444000_11074 [Shimia gijangensis]|uniref:Sulfotransferase family protein n=1 Tax=Shimia gijangensis TaxID=1470563 RepID=A0A1M6KDW6_9RHOB|nr:hypothetical protein [Shimia gijangensis]SHJ57141.1 hypothetical protein SAMN05444000_11074 [Shimia gijangensis]